MSNKENIALFVCDISGTFTSNKEPEDKFDKYNELGSLLEKLVKDKKYDKILFSFMTADDRLDFLSNYVEFFNKYVKNDNIVLGLQFFSNGELNVLLDNNIIESNIYKDTYKENKIANYAKDLSRKYNVKDIIFADDFLNIYNIELIKNELNDSNINVYGLNPFYKETNVNYFYSSNIPGIEGLVNCVQKYVDDKEKINNKQI